MHSGLSEVAKLLAIFHTLRTIASLSSTREVIPLAFLAYNTIAQKAQRTMENGQLNPIVISGPTGAGKSTLLKKVMTEFPDIFRLCVSHTTRSPRPGEVDGKDYYFVSKEDMQAAVDGGDFIEHAYFGGNIYGTSRRALQDVVKSRKLCILDLDIKGCDSMHSLPEYKPLFISIQPPDFKCLEERLRSRGTETDDSFKKRLKEAKAAMEYCKIPGKFDVVIINDDLEKAYVQFRQALMPMIKKALPNST
eukprot:gene5721-9006_t